MPLEQAEIDVIKTSLEKGNFAENPELKKLSDLGFKLHTETTLKTELDTKVEEGIKPKVREIYTQFETDIKTMTGIDKTANEKAYDYLKRAVPDYVKTQQGDDSKKLAGEIVTLKEQLAATDKDGAWKVKFDKQEADYSAAIEGKDKDILTERSNVAAATKRRLLSEAHGPTKANYRTDLPSYFSSTEKLILDEILKNSVVVQDEKGNDVLVEAENGEAKKVDFKVVPVIKRIEDSFKDAVKVKVKPGGAGSGGPGSEEKIDPSKITLETFEMPESIKTQGDLTGHLLSLGLNQGSKVFDEIYDKHRGDMKLR